MNKINRLGRYMGRILLALLILTLAVDVAAQEDGPSIPAPERPRPPFTLEGEIPQHQPRVLKSTLTPEGLTNTIIELPVAADAYIASGFPDQDFGTGSLYLGYNLNGVDNFGAERILLRFDIAGSIPAGAVINDARLRLYMGNSAPAGDPPMGTFVRQTAAAWSETTVTWNTEPAWGPVRAECQVGSAPGWYDWVITGLVEDWVSGAQDNYGMEIIGDEAIQQRERAFHSRETSATLYPRLVIDYTDYDDIEAPIVTVNPLPAFVGRDFTVSWTGTDPGGSGIASYDVQFRVDGGDWADWIMGSTLNSAVFAAGQDGKFYEFRARGTDRAGNVESFGAPEASTTADTRPPSTVVNPLPAIISITTFPVSWTGQDAGSDIQYYDVRYRFNGGSWVLWQNQTLAVDATFTAMSDGHYEFEARAVDNLNMKEAFTGQAEASILVDAVAPFVEPVAWMPVVLRSG